jgi:hypothetical protein
MDLFQESMIILQYFNKRLIKYGTVNYIFLTQKILTAMSYIQPQISQPCVEVRTAVTIYVSNTVTANELRMSNTVLLV